MDRLDTEVTITDPRHSLYGQRLVVVPTESPRGRNWITVLLADGRRRHVRCEATDLVSASEAGGPLPQVSIRTLLPLAYLIQALLRTSQEEIPDGLPLPVDQPPSQDADTAGAPPLNAAAALAGLPAETQRQLAQELARLLRLIGTPASAGLETRHADRDTCR